MGNPRGVRRDFEALEKRRWAAVRLVVEEGWSQSAAARRKPRLDTAQRQRLVTLLLEGPEAHGFPSQRG